MIQTLKNFTLPIAMLIGILFHPWIGKLIFLTPALIFTQLLLTFCRISFPDLRIRGLHLSLLVIQVAGSFALYAVLAQFNVLVAQGVLICVLAPPATASAVVVGMLGGDIAFMASFIFISNLGVALAAPLIFSLVGAHSDLPFLASFLLICRQILPMLVLPLVVAWCIQRVAPKLHGWLLTKTMYSFYLWGVSLAIVMGNTAKFILNQENPDYLNEVLLALFSLLVCGVLFFAGKALGGAFHDRISGGQAMGQKNTVFAIWLALTYATAPVVALAPAFYVVWQNLFNTWQIWRKEQEKKLVAGQTRQV